MDEATQKLFAVFNKKPSPGPFEAALAAGADVRAIDAEGRTPLHHAVGSKLPLYATELLSRGADAAACDQKGNTPLHAAAGLGSAGTLTALLEAGAPLEARNNKGMTALMFAARGLNAVENVKILLARGADLSLRDEAGLDALAHAKLGLNADVFPLLGVAPAPRKPITREKLLEQALVAGEETGCDQAATGMFEDDSSEEALLAMAEEDWDDTGESLALAGADAAAIAAAAGTEGKDALIAALKKAYVQAYVVNAKSSPDDED